MYRSNTDYTSTKTTITKTIEPKNTSKLTGISINGNDSISVHNKNRSRKNLIIYIIIIIVLAVIILIIVGNSRGNCIRKWTCGK